MERMDGADAEAVALARAGDPEGFRSLVERHSRSLFRLAHRLTGNEHDAEDVVQETFLRAYRRLDAFEERANVGSWLYRIAANCAYDVLRARRRRDESSVDGEDGLEARAAIVSDDPAQDRLVFSAEVRQRVRSAMTRMSTLERSAFVLRHFEGWSIEEIGDALDLEPGAAKHSVFRAVRKVREVLAAVAGAVP